MFEPGECIIAKGTIGTSMFFIDMGRAQAVHDKKVVEELSSGDFFGEMTFIATCKRIVKDPSAKFHNIEELQRTCDIRAIEQCRCFELSVSDLMAVGGEEVMRLIDSLQPVAEFRKAKLFSKPPKKVEGEEHRGLSQGKLPNLHRSSSIREVNSYLSQPRGRPSPQAFNSWHGNKNRDSNMNASFLSSSREDLHTSFGRKLESGMDGGVREAQDCSQHEIARCPSRSSRGSGRHFPPKASSKHEQNNARSPGNSMTFGDYMDKRGTKSMGGHQGQLLLEVEGMEEPVSVLCVVDKKLMRIFTDPPAFSNQLSTLNLQGMLVCVAGNNPLAIQLNNGDAAGEEQSEAVRLLMPSISQRDVWLKILLENGAQHSRPKKSVGVRKEFYFIGIIFIIACMILIDLVM